MSCIAPRKNHDHHRLVLIDCDDKKTIVKYDSIHHSSSTSTTGENADSISVVQIRLVNDKNDNDEKL